jgi:hypothetical protein
VNLKERNSKPHIMNNPLDELNLEELETLCQVVDSNFSQFYMDGVLVHGLNDHDRYRYSKIYHEAGKYFISSNLKEGQIKSSLNPDTYKDEMVSNIKIEIEFRK